MRNVKISLPGGELTRNGTFQKKSKQGGLRIYFFENPLEFLIFLLYPGNSMQKKAQPLDIPQNCVRSLGNSKTKNKDPSKFPIIFPWSPLEIPLPY